MNTPKAVLVTGCAGFIGGNFVQEFKKQFPETTVVGIDDFSSGRKHVVDKNIKFYKGSITNAKLVDQIFSENKPEYVFHFAAMPRVSLSVEKPVETSLANIIGSIHLLKASVDHNVKRFIFSSSSSVYGGAKVLPTKESENFPAPKSPYAAQKYALEPFCKIFSTIYGLDTVCLRYFDVYGPGQYGDSPYSTVISAWLDNLYFPKEKKAFLEGDGKQSRDFSYVGDVVNANILAMKSEKNFGGEAFNISGGERIVVSNVKKLIEKYSGRKLDLEIRPARVGDVRHTHADLTKAKKGLGYKPMMKFEDGLKITVDWNANRPGGKMSA